MKEYHRTRRPKYKWHGKDEWAKTKREVLRDKVIVHLGNACIRCGFTDRRALQIDHVNGGGTREVRTISYQRRYNEALTDTTGKYQLLCANCNWIKKYENNESRSHARA